MVNVLILGAGAVGSYIGAWLSKTGHKVTFVEPWNEQVEAVRANGIDVIGPHEPFSATVDIFHIHELEYLARKNKFEIGFICMKAYDTEWAAVLIDRFVKRDGMIVSAQNCWPDETIAKKIGSDRTVGLVMSSIAVASWKPGHVQRAGKERRRISGHVVFRAGEHDGRITNRIEELIKLLDPIDAGIVTENLWGERWAKLCLNSMGNPVNAITGCGTTELSNSPEARLLQICLAREAVTVGLKLGLKVEPFGGATAEEWAKSNDKDIFATFDEQLSKRTGSASVIPSMGQDVKKRRITEIEMMNGLVKEKGISLGVETPINNKIIDAVKQVEMGLMIQSIENVKTILN